MVSRDTGVHRSPLEYLADEYKYRNATIFSIRGEVDVSTISYNQSRIWAEGSNGSVPTAYCSLKT